MTPPIPRPRPGEPVLGEHRCYCPDCRRKDIAARRAARDRARTALTDPSLEDA